MAISIDDGGSKSTKGVARTSGSSERREKGVGLKGALAEFWRNGEVREESIIEEAAVLGGETTAFTCLGSGSKYGSDDGTTFLVVRLHGVTTAASSAISRISFIGSLESVAMAAEMSSPSGELLRGND
jgi:hypothetical protein